MIVKATHVLYLTIVLQIGIQTSVYGHKKETIINYSINENLLLTRCEAKCFNKSPNDCNVMKCFQGIDSITKPGNCPRKPPSKPLERICVDACSNQDYKCPEAHKCCPHTCGTSCQVPDDLDTIDSLPTIPFNLSLLERRKSRRTAELSWDMEGSRSETIPIYFIVEGRSHIGKLFAEHKLSDWMLFVVQPIYDLKFKKNQIEIKRSVSNIKLRPGRWYQFRVASINENGTRGYSNSSKEFQLKENPRIPGPPRNLTVDIMEYTSNLTWHAKIHWNLPKSDLPIDKYKICWSLYLQGNSLSMEQSLVFEPTRSYDLWNLSPNSIYYVQVQAIASYGKKRLKSQKEAKILNTTIPENYTMPGSFNNPRPLSSSISIDNNSKLNNSIISNDGRLKHGFRHSNNLFIKYIPNSLNGLTVRVSWTNTDDDKSNLLDLCHGSSGCLEKTSTGEYRSVKTKKNHFEFIDLKFGTQYSVRLKCSKIINIKQKNIKTFTTPACENFVKKHDINVKC